ncbi:hypothetical protein HPB50_015686 [Hyalomma asiaticum]|uniref:Uncharacterized protein n=1 Tax=Hyalomma asiaticum TaxID=266040 RepID=A0ACB7SYQ9_HYAAI|nr:hypothetical protein HPB50_015686 [Hyalomma asiaticum]
MWEARRQEKGGGGGCVSASGALPCVLSLALRGPEGFECEADWTETQTEAAAFAASTVHENEAGRRRWKPGDVGCGAMPPCFNRGLLPPLEPADLEGGLSESPLLVLEFGTEDHYAAARTPDRPGGLPVGLVGALPCALLYNHRSVCGEVPMEKTAFGVTATLLYRE